MARIDSPQSFWISYLSLCFLWTFSGSSFTNVTERFTPDTDYFQTNFLSNSNDQSNRSNHGRIFSFNNKDSKMRLELSFAIPFVEIPVIGSGKYATYANGHTNDPLVNVNLGALASAGVLAAAALVFVPNVFNGIAPQVLFGRNVDGGDVKQSPMSKVLSRIDEELHTHNIDSSICTQRAVCWLVKNAASKVGVGKGGSIDKIVDGVTSNKWLETLVKGTAVQEAIHAGRNNKNCNLIYSKCNINEQILQSAVRNFVNDV